MNPLDLDDVEDIFSEMTFRINFREPILITLTNLTTETVGDLKQVVENHYNITDVQLLDLGRIMGNDELLSQQQRRDYTIYFQKKIEV